MTSLPHTLSADEVMTQICVALNAAMNRFENRDPRETYESLIEKHRDEVNSEMFGNGDTPGDRLRSRHRARLREE